MHEPQDGASVPAGQPGNGAAAPAAGGSAPAATRPPLARPPLPKQHAGVRSPLQSYVSEPPSELAMMKTYAQELLHQQHQEAAAAQDAASNMPSTSGATAGAGTGSIELPQLSPEARALAFERQPHFQLGTHMGAVKRSPTLGETCGDASVAAGGRMDTATPAQARMRTSIGWVTSRSQSTASESAVLEHSLAGDLIMPAGRPAALAASAWPGGGAAAEAGRDSSLRRRTMHRTSQQAGGASLPSPRSAAGRGADGAADKQLSPTKKPDSSSELDDMESLDYDAESKPWYKRKSFWIIAAPLLISFVFVLAGTLYITLAKQETVSKFEIWRMCYFLAGLPVIWWIGRGTMEFLVYAVEKTMFTWQNALYFMYAVRRPMANCIRAALVCGWWAIMMTAFSSNMDSTLLTWYNNILKVMGCIALFFTANLLKVLFAKMMARKFNQHSHYARMHQALKREYLLHMLLQPRQRYAQLEALEGEEMERDAEGGAQSDEDDMQRTQSAPGTLENKVQKQSSIQRLFRGSFGGKPGAPQLGATHRSRSLKDKFMFWRSEGKDLHPIDEGDEAEDATQHGSGSQDGSQHGGKGGRPALPPDAVALDISVDSSARLVTPESPLLGRSPSSAALPVAHVMPAPVAKAHGASGAHTTPHGSPPPVSKLLRHRSDALEAVGLPAQALAPQLSPRGSQQRAPASGSQTPVIHRRSSDGQAGTAGAAFDAEQLRHLPPVRVSQGSSGAGGGPGSGGGSGSLPGLSREPSVAARRTHRMSNGQPVEVRRSASLQSRLSMRSVQPPAGAGASPAKHVLMHSSSSSSSSHKDGSQRALALKMSKMEKYIRKHALEVTFKDALSRVEHSEKVTSELEAKKLGFYLFHNVRTAFDRDYITLDDLEQFLGEKDAKAALDMLDQDANGEVNVQECCAAIGTVFLDRKNLASSLKDARTIVGKLETVIGVVLHIFMGFMYLLVFEVDVMKTWAGFASLFLGFSFVFGNSIRTTYENVVFLFLVHPYDVGDSLWLDIDQFKVEEIHLSFTVLMNSNNGRVWYPNEKIRIVPFVNLSTSGPKGESFKVLVDIGTSTQVLDQLRGAADGVIKANAKEFSGTLSVNLKEGGGPMKMMISVYYEYSHPGAESGRCSRNRTKMISALSDVMHRAGVRYTWPATADGGHAGAVAAAVSDDAATLHSGGVLI